MTDTISQDLQNKVSSLKALATTHNLLQKGHYPYGYDDAIKQSLSFIQALHEQVMTEAINDPQAELVPELKQLKGGTHE